MTVSEKLRLVQGLHSHAEMFGFSWNDGSDWTWHDVACKIADDIDAENAKLREENARLRSCLSDDAENARMIMGKNAKLRELVRDAIQAIWACDNEICVHRCECDQGIDYPEQMDCLIERRARELGVVDA